MDPATLVLNIGGVHYETTKKALNSKPGTKLSDEIFLEKHFRPSKCDYYFDRSPRLFDHILNYYRVGELHIPHCACAREVSLELEFWGIEAEALDSCCWLHFNVQRGARKSLKSFEKTQIEERRREVEEEKQMSGRGWQKWRARAWRVINDPKSSGLAMVCRHK